MNKLLLLGLVAVFLSLSIPQAHATNDGDIRYGSNISLSFGQSRQPNINLPTEVLASARIQTALLSTETTGLVVYQISNDNVTWENISEQFLNADVAGLGITLQEGDGEGVSFKVGKGQYYRVIAEPLTGSPVFSLRYLHEAELDVFEQDPIPLPMCTQSAKPSETIYCMFTAYYQNNTPRNDLTYNVTVQNQSFTTILNTTATNRGSFGEYVFNFTSQSNVQTYYVRVYNNSVNYAKTITVATQYFGLTPEQNDTLYGITGNVTTNVTTQFNSLNTNLFGNWTEVFLNFSHINDHLHNLTDQVGNITFDETNIIGNITNATNFILLNTTSQFGTTNTNIDNVDNDIFSWIMSNGDTYQEFIEGMDANLTNTNSTLHTHIDNINATCTGCSINATEVWDVVYNSSRTNKTQGTLLIDDWVARFMSPMS